MKQYPDLTDLGYRIDCELGNKRERGLITWKGTCLQAQKTVLIRQFCFTEANSSWNGYEAYEQELRILKDLKHPHIPSYLDSIETEDSFCLVLEFINADNLSHFRSLTLNEIKQVTLKLLDILVYLQEKKNPILHRDIKPGNILLDENLNVYLTNFGFASFLNQELSNNHIFPTVSSFNAPEQITKPTLASDLYSLGITLVCLLMDQDFSTVDRFATANHSDQLELKRVLPSLEPSFFDWLDMMTQPEVEQRFANAATARNELLFFDPQIEISRLVDDNSQVAVPFIAPKILGVIGIILLSAIATWSISFVEQQIRLTFTMVAIAIVAVLAMSISQLGAIFLVKQDQHTKWLGLALSIITSTVIVSASSFFWSTEEAVVIVTANTVAEIFILTGFWWQIPDWSVPSALIKLGGFIGAIIIGIGLGLQLI